MNWKLYCFTLSKLNYATASATNATTAAAAADPYTASTSRSPNVGLMLNPRLRRWTNIKTTLGDWLVFAGYADAVANLVIRWYCKRCLAYTGGGQ